MLKLLYRARRTADERVATLERDVDLTSLALKNNPKNYSVWEHRKWCLQTMGPRANWAFEMKMVEAYLEKDGRNCEAGARHWIRK